MALFAGHDEGAQSWARLASLIGTCRLNGVEADVTLVVPQPIIGKYPASVQPHILTLESFIADVRLLSL